QQGRLAAAGRADQHAELPVGNRETDVAHRGDAAGINFRHVAQRDFDHEMSPLSFAHDLFRKPVPTFRDHALSFPLVSRSARPPASVSNSFSPFARLARRASPLTPLAVISLKERKRAGTVRHSLPGSRLPNASEIRSWRTRSGATTIISEVSTSQACWARV